MLQEMYQDTIPQGKEKQREEVIQEKEVQLYKLHTISSSIPN